MVLYATVLGPVIPDALGNILIALVISTAAGLAVAALHGSVRHPERKHDIIGLGLRSILSGTIALGMSGVVVGML